MKRHDWHATSQNYFHFTSSHFCSLSLRKTISLYKCGGKEFVSYTVCFLVLILYNVILFIIMYDFKTFLTISLFLFFHLVIFINQGKVKDEVDKLAYTLVFLCVCSCKYSIVRTKIRFLSSNCAHTFVKWVLICHSWLFLTILPLKFTREVWLAVKSWVKGLHEAEQKNE